jgi:pimeloyl-ACP methyl ester carboxylesterase
MPPPARAAMLDNAPGMASEVRTPPGELYPELTRDEVSRIDVPVLLLDGEASPRMFGVVQDLLASCLPVVEQVTIPGASHAMHAGNAEAYNGAVLAFLARH